MKNRNLKLLLLTCILSISSSLVIACRTPDSNTASAPGQSTDAAPDITEESESPSGQDLTIPNTDLELDSPQETSTVPVPEATEQDAEVPAHMMLLMDSLMMCSAENDYTYDSSDPVFFWEVLCYTLANHGDIHSLITKEANEMKVPRQTAQEFASALFSDYSDLPEIPGSLDFRVRYDESFDAYIVSLGNRGTTDSEALFCEKRSDNTYSIKARFFDVTDLSTIATYQFTLVPNVYADGIADPLFLYSIQDMSKAE